MITEVWAMQYPSNGNWQTHLARDSISLVLKRFGSAELAFVRLNSLALQNMMASSKPTTGNCSWPTLTPKPF